MCNLILGALSLIFTLQDNYRLAAVLILLAVFMDGMDGRLARRLSTTSELGKQLDSLCDLVSFGVAPSLLIYNQVFTHGGSPLLGTLLFLFFIVCGAFRLARFNVSSPAKYFVGVPITMAGFLMACLSLVSNQLPRLLIGLLVLALSLLMISTWKVKNFK
jgi:CDP-diacylglycerol--serine O-phosphatidyltransferase